MGGEALSPWTVVEEVRGSRPVEISSAWPGLTVSGIRAPQGRYPIGFSVGVEFDLRVSEPTMGSAFAAGGPEIPLDQPTELSTAWGARKSFTQPRVSKDIMVARDVTVEATVSEEGAEQGNFGDLRIGKVLG
jgi:hypothetical protein